MAAKGYRLMRTTQAMYEFDKCNPRQYQYKVEFVGQKSRQNAQDYVQFLEDCGYRVFFKNINLNYSIGKVQWRPWAENGGKVATNSSTYNRELLIVEKINDGKPFELHTTYEDKLDYYKDVRKPWIFLFIVSAILGICLHQIVWGAFSAISIIILITFQIELAKLKKQSNTKEW